VSRTTIIVLVALGAAVAGFVFSSAAGRLRGRREHEVNDPRVTLDRAFGLMLFSTGESDELEQLNESGELPEPRPATGFAPSLPPLLEPGASWEGTMSASGALVARSWARVVFGTFVAAGKPPDELPERIVWITDHAYRLRR